MSWRSTRLPWPSSRRTSNGSTRSAATSARTTAITACCSAGKTAGPPHPDTITRRFKQLAAAAGLPEIDLHDVRHSYATASRDAKIDWKALSKRIGHADVALTMKQYVQTDLEADRQVANALAQLIIGGSLASIEMADETGERALLDRTPAQIRAQTTCRRPSLCSRKGLWPW